jgi:Pyridoxamine 5'-phosphate oxidase
MRLTADMRAVVFEQRLGYHPTVSPDRRPNLSPKGTTTIFDDEHLMFVHISSPQTIANLRANRRSRRTSKTRSCGAATGSVGPGQRGRRGRAV